MAGDYRKIPKVPPPPPVVKLPPIQLIPMDADRQKKTAENLAAALSIPVEQLTDDDMILLPPRARQDNGVQRARRMKMIFVLISEGTPVHKACEQYDLDNWTFSKIVGHHQAWKKLYKQALDRQTERLKNLAVTCALKAEDDPRYQRSLEFTLKLRSGYFNKRDDRIIVQAPTAATIERKVVYEEIAESPRKPPIKADNIVEPEDVPDDDS